MKRILPLGVVIGIIFLALGVLFLLAAVAAPENWILAIFFLGIGLLCFGGSVYLMVNLKPQNRQEEDSQWLPIDELGKETWFWLTILPWLLVLGGVLYLMTSDDWRAYLLIVPGFLIFLTIAFLNFRAISNMTKETAQVLQIEPEFRGVVRQAFGARRVLWQIVGGIKGDRRDFWTRYLNQADEIVRLVLVTAKRASDLKASGSTSFSTWKDKLKETKQALDKLTEKLATATSEIELESLERGLSDVSDSLRGLDDKIAASKEVQNYPKG